MIGETVNGARLWVHFGGIQFQPGELAKIMLIVFLAGYLREKREVLAQGRIKDFGPLLAIWGAAMLVLVETNDLGSGLLYFGIFLAMLYVATARAWFVGAGLVLFVAGTALVYKAVPRVEERVSVWIDPWKHSHTTGYQIIQSLYSIGNGGFDGKGFGKGVFATTNGHDLIPFLPTDFIYSALAQELGLVGSAALLLVYMLFCLRGFRVAMLAQDGFSKLLALGLTFGFALQTFIIVGGVLRIIPLTGITLPFVSYGGSSVVANFVLLAGLLLVSHRANASSQLAMEGSREPPDHARRGRRARPARLPDRRDDVLAGLGGERAGRPAGQRDPARRRVHGQARRRSSPATATRSWPTTTGAGSAGRRSTSASTRSAASRPTSSATRPRCARGPGSRSPRTTS